MNPKIVLIAALALAVAGPSVCRAQDADADRNHPGDFVKDSAITAKIKSKLAVDHVTSLAHIRVDTDRDGVVWLSGTTRSRDAAEQAEDIARHTDGVRSVKNHIAVRETDD
jgi:hyperosmotically inducible periplasmic protein